MNQQLTAAAGAGVEPANAPSRNVTVLRTAGLTDAQSPRHNLRGRIAALPVFFPLHSGVVVHEF
jgi:hypothetical protein